MKSDVLIIGGGVIGLSIARELHKRGVRRITIVDRGVAGYESSWAAAGMLAPNIETDTNDDFHRFGMKAADLYPDLADALRSETSVDIHLDQAGTLCVAFNEAELAELDETFQRQIRRDVTVERLSGTDIRDIEPSISPVARGGLFYPSDWQVENRKLVQALRTFAEINEIRMVENSEVDRLITDGKRVVGARTAGGEMHADATILATGAWTSLIKIGDSAVPVSVRPIRGQMISFETGERKIRRVIYSHRGYVVPRANGRVLVGATVEDVGFDKRTTAEGVNSLRSAAVEIVSALEQFAVADSWSGLRPFVADGLPVIGNVPGYDDLFVATGHYRNGILLAPLTGKIIAEKITGTAESDYFRVFGAARFSTAVVANTHGSV